MKLIVGVIVLLSLAAFGQTFDNYFIGETYYAQFEPSNSLVLQPIFTQTLPAVITVSLVPSEDGDTCIPASFTVGINGGTSRYAMTGDSWIVMPIYPWQNATEFLVVSLGSTCNATITSTYVNETKFSVGNNVTTSVAGGSALFFAGSNDQATEIVVNPTSGNCTYMMSWQSSLMTPTQDYTNSLTSMVIYPYYGMQQFHLLIVAYNSSSNCGFTVTSKSAVSNTAQYVPGFQMALTLSDQYYAFLNLTGLSSDNPIQIAVQAETAIVLSATLSTINSKTISKVFLMPGECFLPIGGYQTEQIVITIKANSGTLGNVTISVQELVPQTLATNTIYNATLQASQYIYYQFGPISISKPQYLTLNFVTPMDNFWELLDFGVFLDSPDYPDPSNLGSSISLTVNASQVQFAVATLAGQHYFQIAIIGYDQANVSFSISMNDFPALTSGTPLNYRAYGGQFYYFSYQYTPSASPTFQFLQLNASFDSTYSVYWKWNDMPTVFVYDGFASNFGSPASSTLYYNKTGSATLYIMGSWPIFFKYGSAPMSMLIKEMSPFVVSAGVDLQLPFTCSGCWNYFTINSTADVVTFSQTVYYSMTVYYAWGALPTLNSTSAQFGVIVKNTTSWDNLIVGYPSPLWGTTYCLWENGIAFPWEGEYPYGVNPVGYFQTVIPTNASFVEVKFECGYTGTLQPSISWGTPVTQSTSVIRVPQQGSPFKPYTYTVPLSLQAETALYMEVGADGCNVGISVSDRVLSSVSMQNPNVNDTMIAFWRYYSIDWFTMNPLWSDDNYQLTFTLTANTSTSRMTFVYQENAVPSDTNYQHMGTAAQGNTIVIKFPVMNGAKVPQFGKTVGYLGVYFGTDPNAEPINYSIVGDYKEVTITDNTVWYVLGGIGGAVLLCVIVVIVVVVVRNRRRRGYEMLNQGN